MWDSRVPTKENKNESREVDEWTYKKYKMKNQWVQEKYGIVLGKTKRNGGTMVVEFV